MAIEASRQLIGDKKITGFQLRRVSIKRALIVPDTKEGIEVSLSMTTVDGPSDLRTWRRFQISSFNESSDEWTEHCTGYIAPDSPQSEELVEINGEKEVDSHAWGEALKEAHKSCSQQSNFETTYDDLDKIDLQFGPLFRNLCDVRTSGAKVGLMTGSVKIPDIMPSMPKQYMHQHLIHPATMDSMIHMMIAAAIDFIGQPTLDQIRLPTYVQDMWVSSDMTSEPFHKFKGHALVSNANADKLEGQIRVMDAQGRPCVRMDGIELTPLESTSIETDERGLCTAIEWKPDVHFLDSSQACKLSSIEAVNNAENRYWVKQLQMATMLYVTDALNEITDLKVDTLDWHVKRFHEWMTHWNGMLVKNEIIHLPYAEFQSVRHDQDARQAIFTEIESHSAEGAITARMGRNIAAIMRKEVDPLALMFGQDNVMEGVYKEGLHLYDLPKHLKSHLSLLSHKSSGLRVLEIGGGTGSFTAEVFSVLAPRGKKAKNIASYVFTDISAGFFEKAKHRFQNWSDIMTFQPLNIEKNPTDQGLEDGSFDLIFAGNVIHATKNLHTSLGHLRSLLRPGGQLVMQEGIRQDFLWYPLVFGQLPGWWLGDEPIRKWCPYIPASEWDTLLTESGFSGVSIEYPSSNDEDLTWQSILVATACPVHDQAGPNVFVLTSQPERIENAIEKLEADLKCDFRNITFLNPSQLNRVASANALFISLVDFEGPYLSQISETDYIELRRVLTECQNILWVSPTPDKDPLCGLMLGLLRTIRHERDSDGSNIVTLTIPNDDSVLKDSLASVIRLICVHQFAGNSDTERHAEYRLQDGTIEVGRLRDWEKAENFVGTESSVPAPETLILKDIGRPVEVPTVAAASHTLNWTTDSQHNEELGPGQVEIDVRAIGLSSNPDLQGRSTEASGVVKRVGAEVKEIFPWENVVVTGSESKTHCLRTCIRADAVRVVKIPQDVQLEVAAALPSVYATALYGLRDVAGLRKANAILVHDAATALGQAAIQCAQMIEAIIYVTVSTIEDCEFLEFEYGIPRENIFAYKDLGFAKSIVRLTNGAGVDVVFNTLTGEVLQETASCLASFGHFIHVSRKGTRSDAMIDLALLQKCATMATIDIELMMERRPETVARLVRDALKLCASGKISSARPFTVMNLGRVQDGIDSLRSKERSGKIVCVPGPSDVLSVVPDSLPSYQFDGQASYVLAGGLGGIGRSVARWMASRGARNLIFLSRSGRRTAAVNEMILNLQSMGCQSHVFTCDVSDVARLKAVIQSCSASMPQIKGCIQGSMVLEVSSSSYLICFGFHLY